MFEKIKLTIEKIKKLEIQGATSIAISGLKSILESLDEIYSNKVHAKEILKELKFSRDTEPFLRNVVNFVEFWIYEKNMRKEEVEGNILKLLDIINESKIKIAEIGEKLIENGMKIFTICHSSIVENTLKFAKDKGKDFIVYSCETRPKFQGRITSKNLSEYGIKVIHFVDSAMGRFIKEVDLVFVGADSILASGAFVNKVGTYTLAILADKYDIPLYSLTSLLKTNLTSFFGYREKIEERDYREVWDYKNDFITIRNPAFDVIPSKYVTAFITEEGIIPPQNILDIAMKYFDKIRKKW